jgi:hypothetical protein
MIGKSAHHGVITNLNQITSAWLTAVLSDDGAMSEGEVEAFEVETGRGNWSTNAGLVLRYSEGAQGSLPKRLFLKMVDTGCRGQVSGWTRV